MSDPGFHNIKNNNTIDANTDRKDLLSACFENRRNANEITEYRHHTSITDLLCSYVS